MTKKEIIEKVIQKALDNGWVNSEGFIFDTYNNFVSNDGDGAYINRDVEALIFDHEFAKAVWGDRATHTGTMSLENVNDGRPFETEIIDRQGWQHHLQVMVVSEDPIKYLQQFL